LRVERELLLKSTISNEEAEELYKRIKHNESSDVYALKRNWSTEETKLFFYTVAKVLKEKHKTEQELTPKDWNQIAIAIPGRSAEQCMYKWGMARIPKTKKSAWCEEENVCLLAIIQRRGAKDWRSIADELNLMGTYKRKPKQCRERWHNFLNPEISRDEWSLKDDLFLLERIEEVGKKWSQVAKKLPGRTENSIKNRYNSIIRIERRKHFEESKEKMNLNFSSAINAVFDSTTEEEKLEQYLFQNLLERLRKINTTKQAKVLNLDSEGNNESHLNTSNTTAPTTPEKCESEKPCRLNLLNISSSFQQPHRIQVPIVIQQVLPMHAFVQPVVKLPTFAQVLHTIWFTQKLAQKAAQKK